MRAFARIEHQDIPPESTVTAVHAAEGLSELFDVRVELLCADAGIDLKSMIWSTAAVTMTPEHVDSAPRSFHGVVEEARYLGATENFHRYMLRLRPAIHGLRYRVRTRIFQELSAVDIIKQIFTDSGISSDAVRWDTRGDHPVREYCTQWKESELDFVLRLLEDEGIFYWFEHTDIDHTLCFGDDASVHQSIEGDPVVLVTERAHDELESISSVVYRTQVVHDLFQSRDWYFEKPDEPSAAESGDGGLWPLYEYPGGYRDADDGARLADIRLEDAWRDKIRLSASGSCLRLAEGRKLEIVDVLPASLAGEYLITRLTHQLETPADAVGDNRTGSLTQTLECIPSQLAYRPARVTPRPVAHGLESAVVTGPGGEEIHVDSFGRIKVHFYWDRESPVDDTASCWIRFQQLNTQGAMVLPRVGWEVHVAFENGDPDRPVALHKAYNDETMPPYGLPANKTQSALQSSTSPGGGSTNEVRLQDGSGGMDWFLHASKDLNCQVANDENETIGVDSSESVGSTQSRSVGGDETGTIGGNQSISVSVGAATETNGAKSVTIGANDDWGITGGFGFQTTKDRTEDIGGLMNVLANEVAITVNGSLSRTVGAVQAIVSATAIGETVAGSKSETVSAAKAVITPAEYQEQIAGAKTLTCGAVTVKTGGDVAYTAKGAVAVTSAALISIECADDAMFSGSQIRVTSGSAKMKGGGGTFKLGGSITIDAKKFGGKGGPLLKLKGNLDYK